VGIPAEDLGKLFEPFYTKKVMGRSGTGLGLAVVWGTVKDHQGYVMVESVEGRGTTFDIYLPSTPQEMRIAPDTEPAACLGNGETVLVVDDIAQQRRIASAVLERLGYNVEVAASGEEAVEYMKTRSADLVVLDMIMEPGIDGLDAYRGILAKHPRQKAVITSGFAETDRVKEALRLGAGPYVKKPYTMEGLGRAVKEALAKGRSD
jgi:CheY-like chemotaxis protein